MVTSRMPDESDADYLSRLAGDGDAGARLRADADRSDTWQLQRDDAESDDDFALRALALGCGADYSRRISRRSLALDERMGS